MAPYLDSRRYQTVKSITPYLLAILLTGVTTVFLFLLKDTLNPTILALLYLLPVGLSSLMGGLGPGITASLAAFLGFNYFFIQPFYTLMVHQSQDLLVLLVFLGIAVVISQLVGRTRHSLAQATARELEAIRLYEFSNLLSGLHNESEIIQAITNQTQHTFEAEQVEVYIEGAGGQQAKLYSQKARELTSESLPPKQQSFIIPMQTARGLLGEIRIWRSDPPIQEQEERLLRTFASQGVLAIERARLLQADTRARVLEESDRMKTSLLSSVSHELRTPLATIKAYVSSLRSKEFDWDSEARQELLEAVDEETDHLNQLVENLLNMSRIEAGVLRPKREWNSLEEIIASVMKRFRQPVKPLTHSINLNLPDNLPLIPVDYLQIEQVFTNLISNSMKYSPDGSAIDIDAVITSGEQLQIRIANQGPPVPVENLERIFDKFYRASAADQITGTGLGLSICKGIIEAHGGRIWAENLPAGFAFTFTLPLTWQGELPRLPSEAS